MVEKDGFGSKKPSGKHTKNYGKSMKISIFNGKTHYKRPFSIAMC